MPGLPVGFEWTCTAAYDQTRARVFDLLRADQLGRVDVAVTDLLTALETDYDRQAPANASDKDDGKKRS